MVAKSGPHPGHLGYDRYGLDAADLRGRCPACQVEYIAADRASGGGIRCDERDLCLLPEHGDMRNRSHRRPETTRDRCEHHDPLVARG
jgi:hypothetical protein